MEAAMRGNLEIVDLLLSYGAQKEVKDEARAQPQR